MTFVAEQRDTIPVTCWFDGRAHDVSDDNMVARDYRALCGHLPVTLRDPLTEADAPELGRILAGAADPGALTADALALACVVYSGLGEQRNEQWR